MAMTAVRAGAGRVRHRVEGRWRYHGQLKAASLLVQRYGDRVAGGPFVGMRYPVPAEIDLCLPPKLAGRYEHELHDVVEAVAARPWARIVDVGCAGGFYTTGFALRCPTAQVVGFEGDPTLAGLARATAEANGVGDRVDIRGFCEPGDLEGLLGAGTFLLLDVEGHETVLADPQRLPALAATTLLVELHDFLRAGLSSELLGRFAPTHRQQVVHAARPSGPAVPEAASLPAHLRRWVVDEHRPPGMRWLFCEPLDAAAAAPPTPAGYGS